MANVKVKAAPVKAVRVKYRKRRNMWMKSEDRGAGKKVEDDRWVKNKSGDWRRVQDSPLAMDFWARRKEKRGWFRGARIAA